MRFSFILSLFFFSSKIFGQQESLYFLPKELNEISGLIHLNDSLFLALNDSGNKPIIYAFQPSGKILKKVKLCNAPNIDWEDLSFDANSQTVFVGDFGNNANRRTQLSIYFFALNDFFTLDSLQPKRITFTYALQKSFPPESHEMDFDMEAMAFKNDSLFLFSKCSFKHCSGLSHVYVLPIKEGHEQLVPKTTLHFPHKDYLHNGITSATFVGDTLYLLTYKEIKRYLYQAGKFLPIGNLVSSGIGQKEAICVGEQYYFISEEKNKLFGGPNLYFVPKRKDDFK